MNSKIRKIAIGIICCSMAWGALSHPLMAEEAPEEENITLIESAEEVLENVTSLTPDEAETRIVLYGEKPEGDCGASSITYYEPSGQYILEYDSPEAAQEALENMDESADAHLDGKLTLDNLTTSETNEFQEHYTWGLDYMGLTDYADGIEGYNEPITVAVLDTGIDLDNEFFAGTTISEASRDFTDSESGSFNDLYGHGTHVAGIIADCTPSNVELLILRVFNDNGESSWTWVAAAIEYAIEQGADVINLSFGDATITTGVLDTVAQNAYDNGIAFVCAAGNDTQDTIWYPAVLDTTICVSSINRYGRLAGDSSYGEKVDFCAPGVDIESAFLCDSGLSTHVMSGTSMATPHASAAFAFLKMKNPDMSVGELKEEAKKIAKDIGDEGKDNLYGYGYLDFTGYFDKESADVSMRFFPQEDDPLFIIRLYPASVEDSVILNDIEPGTYAMKNKYRIFKETSEQPDGREANRLVLYGLSPGSYKLLIQLCGKHVPVIVPISSAEEMAHEEADIWLYGDVTKDGVIKANDITQCLRHMNGQSSLFDSAGEKDYEELISICDINRDGRLAVGDTTQIKRWLNGSASLFDNMV